MLPDDDLEIIQGEEQPSRKAAALVRALKTVLLDLDEDARRDVLSELSAAGNADKTMSMVHL